MDSVIAEVVAQMGKLMDHVEKQNANSAKIIGLLEAQLAINDKLRADHSRLQAQVTQLERRVAHL